MEASVLIALVEDEAVLQVLLATELKDAGYAVVCASSGEEGLAILEERASEVRALVTDIRLSRKGLTGWDIAHRARELNPNIPVVYVSGDSSSDWSANGVPKSVMITKPFVGAQVITAISQLLIEVG
jgi:CheY-like chemotaxis protein